MKRFFITSILCFSLLFNTAVTLAANDASESPVIAYPASYDTTKEGASSYQGVGNVKASPYYPAIDFYQMKPTTTLIILPHYQTYQQTTEITCGPVAALTVLNYLGNTSWQEKEIADIMGTKPSIGTDVAGMVKFFKKIGWKTNSSLDNPAKNPQSFATEIDFKNFVLKNLKENTPIMIENIDWGGHWRVIIGYDTMGTDTMADDVLILADSYDTADHQQDGYVVAPAEKFYYMWFDSHMLPQKQQIQPWLTAVPK